MKHSHLHSASRVRPAGQTNTLAFRLVIIPPRVIDIALAAFLVWWTIQNSTSDAEPLWATVLLAAAALSLVVRRRWPVPVILFAGGNGSTPPGHGLEGIHERVALFGGKLSTGPNPGRGYLVHAELP